MKRALHRLLIPLEYLLVLLYILFEEIVWEGIAEPIYEAVRSLHLLQRLERRIHKAHRAVILLLFLALFLLVEGAGLAAGALVVGGYPLYGALLYALKIPVAALTFWLFRVSREKLMSFSWFAAGYGRLMAWIAWLKSTEIYRRSMERLGRVKASLKSLLVRIRNYFSGEGAFRRRLARLYRFFRRKLFPGAGDQ
jgi:hypothetical protein